MIRYRHTRPSLTVRIVAIHRLPIYGSRKPPPGGQRQPAPAQRISREKRQDPVTPITYCLASTLGNMSARPSSHPRSVTISSTVCPASSLAWRSTGPPFSIRSFRICASPFSTACRTALCSLVCYWLDMWGATYFQPRCILLMSAPRVSSIRRISVSWPSYLRRALTRGRCSPAALGSASASSRR